LTYFLDFRGGGSHLYLQFADAVGVGSLGWDKGILHAFEAAGHLQYKLTVSVDERDRIVTGSGIPRGAIGARAFLRRVGRLRCARGSKAPHRHVEVELVQGYDERRVLLHTTGQRLLRRGRQATHEEHRVGAFRS
jgi:hypothetical protein